LEGLEAVELRNFSSVAGFFTQLTEDLFVQGQKPAPGEDSFGREISGRLLDITLLGFLGIQGEDEMAAAALLGFGMAAFLVEEIVERGEQKGAELAFGPVCGA